MPSVMRSTAWHTMFGIDVLPTILSGSRLDDIRLETMWSRSAFDFGKETTSITQ